MVPVGFWGVQIQISVAPLIFFLISSGVGIKSIAITAYSELRANHNQAVSPCGDCRQVMAEYEHRYHHNIRLIMEAEDGKFIVSGSVRQLLPYMFNADNIL